MVDNTCAAMWSSTDDVQKITEVLRQNSASWHQMYFGIRVTQHQLST